MIKEVEDCNIIKWQEFKISDIFDIKKGERLTESNRISGEIPLVTKLNLLIPLLKAWIAESISFLSSRSGYVFIATLYLDD